MVLSSDAEYNNPVPPHLIHVTLCVWLDSVIKTFRKIISQILIVPSFEADAKRRHSGLLKDSKKNYHITNQLIYY